MKSKKMTKSTFAIIIMAIAIVALLAFGGSYAYFTATAKTAVANVTTGKIQLKSNAAATATISDAVTGTPVLGAVTYQLGETDIDSYVFVKLSVSGTLTPQQLFGANIAVKEGWTLLEDDSLSFAAGETVYYQEVTDENLAAFKGAFIDALSITQGDDWSEAEDGDTAPAIMGKTFSITVAAKSIQSFGFADEVAAYKGLTW